MSRRTATMYRIHVAWWARVYLRCVISLSLLLNRPTDDERVQRVLRRGVRLVPASNVPRGTHIGHNATLWALLLVLGVAGCSEPQPGQGTIPAVGQAATQAVVAVVDALPLPPPPAPPVEPAACIPDRAIDLIIAFEIGSPARYTAHYQSPIWPGASSGATVGIGYDLGHRAGLAIAHDWALHPQHPRMQTASGITGPGARNVVAQLADITVAYDMARAVFDRSSLAEHCAIARRVFVPAQFDAAPPLVQGALVSVVFNRGGSMTGASRAEMRAIRDDCLPRADADCVAAQILAMTRLWRGKDIEAGMRRRRAAEADLARARA